MRKQIQPLKAKDIKVVQLNGGVAKSASSTGASQIVDALTMAGHGIGYMFPVPAIVDSKLSLVSSLSNCEKATSLVFLK